MSLVYLHYSIVNTVSFTLIPDYDLHTNPPESSSRSYEPDRLGWSVKLQIISQYIVQSKISRSMCLSKLVWLEYEENYEDWKYNITLLLSSKGPVSFIKKECIAPDPNSDNDDSQRMTCTMSIKRSCTLDQL